MKNMLEFQKLGGARKRIFSAVSCAAVVMVFILVDSFVYNVSLFSTAFETYKKSSGQFLSDDGDSGGALQLELNFVKTIDQRDFRPPINVTEDRIACLQTLLPKSEIFKSMRLTQQFEERVRRFFIGDCEARFFMTWISPAESFGRREFIAMNSLFKAHPRGCLMILSTTMDSRVGDRLLKPLRDRGFRVIAVAPDAPFLVKNTPAETWFAEMKSGNKDPGQIPFSQNLSNLLRLAVLYKYGGVYLDTDFIVLNKFSSLRNTIGAQSLNPVNGTWSRLNNAVLIFDKNHPLVYKFIEEFAMTFDGNKWGHNGPYLVSRVVSRVAKRPGYNFTVLPPIAFYPANWNQIGGYFSRPEGPAASKWAKAQLVKLRKEAYGLHLWNRQSSKLEIQAGSILARLILDHCSICDHDIW